MTSHNLSSTLGVIYWGFVVATVLLGTSIIQGYFFFLGSKVSWKLKAFVALLLTLNLATTALSSGYLNYYLIIVFGDPLALLYVTKPYIAEYVVTIFIILLAQLFYAWRIYTVKRTSLPFIITALALIAFSAGLVSTCELFSIGHLITRFPDRKLLICLGVATSFAAVCDLVSSAAMCYLLASPRSSYKQTNSMIAAFIFFAVDRGALAAFAQVATLVMFLAFPTKVYWMPFHLCLSKLYVNTLLAMLSPHTAVYTSSPRLEIRTSYISANTASPTTPSRKYSGHKKTTDLFGPESPNDKRMSMGYHLSRVHPHSVEEGYSDSEVNISMHGGPGVKVFTEGGDIEPITFA